jgi:hypothetical protein
METFTYEVIISDSGFETIKRTSDDGVVSYIPADLGNSDYAAYLESLETPAPKAK